MSPADTIVAISTAAGSATRAIIRLSGPKALDLAAGVFHAPGTALHALGGFRATDGRVAFGWSGPADAAAAEMEVPERAYVFRAPRSYTRQDVVELHVPGAAAVATALTAALIRGGARAAEPG